MTEDNEREERLLSFPVPAGQGWPPQAHTHRPTGQQGSCSAHRRQGPQVGPPPPHVDPVHRSHRGAASFQFPPGSAALSPRPAQREEAPAGKAGGLSSPVAEGI